MQGMIKLVKLVRSKPSVRHCEIELCQAPQAEGQAALYLVNLREGSPDAEWQESSKTPFPVSLDKAQNIFSALLASKLEQGYADTAADSPPDVAPTTTARDDAMQWGHSSQTLVQKIAKPQSQQEQEKILLDRLHPRAWSGLSRAERSRTVWRIGERRLAAAVPRLVELIASGEPILDYCIAHAIGRCGDAGAAQAMHELSQRSKDEHVRHIALHAWLALCSTEERQNHARSLLGQWPADLHDAWLAAHEKSDVDAGLQELVLCLLSAKNWKHWRHDDWLEQLDCMAQAGIYALARPLLVQQLKNLPVSLLVYRAFRHLYKLAEFRADAELFGVLHQRFEKSWPLFAPAAHDSHVYLDRRYVRYSDEVKKPNTRVAYSKLTRDYLRRRSWRTLRRLGALSSPDFVHMATGVLLACDDVQADKPHIQRLMEWNRQRRAYDVELRYNGPYASWMVFNHLLHRHDNPDNPFTTSRTARKWWQAISPEAAADPATYPAYPQRDKRLEAYPHLWDAAPDQLLRLLQRSQCLGVHAFAARALIDNKDFCVQLEAGTLQGLLQSPYLPTKDFAFSNIKLRFAGQTPDLSWLSILLTADYEPAADFALDYISQAPERYAQDAGLLLTMIVSPMPRVRAACRLLAQSAVAATRAILLNHMLHWANTSRLQDTQAAPLLNDLQWLIQNLLDYHVAQLPDADLLAWCNLLLAQQFWQQVLVTDVLLAHPAGIAHIAPDTLRDLLQHADPGRQSLGSRLFAALPASILQEQPDLVASLATASDARVRAAMTPVITQLATHTAFTDRLLPHLIDVMFRSDIADENASVHADIIQWCQGPLLTATLALPADMQWRLLQARSQGAQELGCILLAHAQGTLAASLSVLQWALLGRHAILQVRLQAQTYFTTHLAEVRQQLNDALRILDTRWPETRAFATDYFASHITAEEWTLNQLLALCDHQQAAVQRLGRQLITRHFRVEEAADYVLNLSQHPAASMQLFVSQWLEQSVSNAPDMTQALQHLQQLRPYFLSVLSHVNKARTVKNRVIHFLQGQGLLSEDHARFVAQIFTRQVLTVAIQDKAQYILGLTQLQAQYPAVAQADDWPLQVMAPRNHVTGNTIDNTIAESA
ncbi:hypothetical protein [Undibacterium sp. TS12]|uniref:hypothetical protein n=1 Tax=Undibacterium sp. TS12 TaxID=2908202 RepID=UPI001F4CBD3E|nr:hypothetical protein [Undibacterium sp. TS12]MCH8619557.1 hypothetical protein [Undibacterium sp. TS12]